jgi:hypothetical protein
MIRCRHLLLQFWEACRPGVCVDFHYCLSAKCSYSHKHTNLEPTPIADTRPALTTFVLLLWTHAHTG